jgi:ParB/RepB/Spo0J family partition protein
MAPPVGILEPLVVRPLPSATCRAKHLDLARGPFYEIVAGERRWRAAENREAALDPDRRARHPDDQVIKLQLVENKNREDIHPLDEAEAMERLLKMNQGWRRRTIAATIGMSERYVQNRLHYLRLAPEVKEAFRKDEITAGHVDLLMRLPRGANTRVQRRLFEDRLQFDDDDETRKSTRRELRQRPRLNEWIAGNVRLQVATRRRRRWNFLPEVAEAVARGVGRERAEARRADRQLLRRREDQAGAADAQRLGGREEGPEVRLPDARRRRARRQARADPHRLHRRRQVQGALSAPSNGPPRRERQGSGGRRRRSTPRSGRRRNARASRSSGGRAPRRSRPRSSRRERPCRTSPRRQC